MSLSPLDIQQSFNTATSSLELQKAMSLKKSAAQGDASLRKAVKDFEGFMMGQMYKSMYESVPKSDLFGDAGFARDVFMGIYVDEVSKKSSMGDSGLAAMMYKQITGKKLSEVEKDLEKIQKTRDLPQQDLTKEVEKMASTPAEDSNTARQVMDDLLGMAQSLSEKQSSGFGLRHHPIFKKQMFHHGIDYALPKGQDVATPASGKITFAGKKGGYGNTVVVDHGHGISSLYAHLASVDVKEGQTLTKGETIGKIGSTGISTGPHLHFEVRKDDKPIDPKRLASLEKTVKGL